MPVIQLWVAKCISTINKALFFNNGEVKGLYWGKGGVENNHTIGLKRTGWVLIRKKKKAFTTPFSISYHPLTQRFCNI